MIRQIVVLVSWILLTTPCAAAPSYASAVNDIPFSFERGLVIVEATIKGNVPVQVVLATGAEHSTADPELLKKYELSVSYAGEGPVNGVNDKIYFYANVSRVQVGD